MLQTRQCRYIRLAADFSADLQLNRNEPRGAPRRFVPRCDVVTWQTRWGLGTDGYTSIPPDPVIIEVEIRESARTRLVALGSRRIIPRVQRAIVGEFPGSERRFVRLSSGRKRPPRLARGGNTREKLLEGNNRAMLAELASQWASNRRRIRCHVTFLYPAPGCIACLLDRSIPRGRTCRGWAVPCLIWQPVRGSRQWLLLVLHAAKNQTAFISDILTRWFNETNWANRKLFCNTNAFSALPAVYPVGL